MKIKIPKSLRKVSTSLSKHMPEILTGFGLAGMFSSIVMGVKATPEAIQLIDKRKEELGVEELTIPETIRTAGKCYIPTIATAAVSAGCIIGSTKMSVARSASLLAAAKLSETELLEYKEQASEFISERDQRKIDSAIAQKKVEEATHQYEVTLPRSGGATLCYDLYSGRPFFCDRMKLEKGVNEVNRITLNEGYASLNDYYDLIEQDRTKLGDEVGWNSDMPLTELIVSSVLWNDQPCLAFQFSQRPVTDFDRCV